MKTFMLTLAALGFAATLPALADTAKPAVTTASPIFAQEDCKEGEKWNEETQKCEENSG